MMFVKMVEAPFAICKVNAKWVDPWALIILNLITLILVFEIILNSLFHAFFI